MKRLMLLMSILTSIFIISSCKKDEVKADQAIPKQEQVVNKTQTVLGCNLLTKTDPPQRSQKIMTAGSVCVFIDWDGDTLIETAPNYYWTGYVGHNVGVPPPALNSNNTAKNYINSRVIDDFTSWDVTVTTDSTVFLNWDAYHRIRVVLTDTYDWAGFPYSGSAYMNSMSWGFDVKCIVWPANTWSGDWNAVSNAISHEVAHTMGVEHAKLNNGNCDFMSYSGYGYIEGWGPIMGINGPSSITNFVTAYIDGCGSTQDEFAQIGNYATSLSDDNTHTVASYSSCTAPILSNGPWNWGILETTSDYDVYKVAGNAGSGNTTVTFNSYGNLDLEIKVYDLNGSLITTVNTSNDINVSYTWSGFNPKVFKVYAATSGPYAPSGVMVGKYAYNASW